LTLRAGLLDRLLTLLGITATSRLGDLALGSIVAITVWRNTGYYMLFSLAGLAGVPNDLADAARIDGAGPFTQQVGFALAPTAPSAFVMEPPAFMVLRWTAETGVSSHHAYVEAYPGPYPFLTESEYPRKGGQ
jgi:sn-glycerol 3-phosphate transport system permease protein